MSTLNNAYLEELFEKHQLAADCPSPKKVIHVFDRLLGVLFPEYSEAELRHFEDLKHFVEEIRSDLIWLVTKSMEGDEEAAENAVNHFFDELPNLRANIVKDIDAMYLGDPAAKSKTEVVRTYPGFYAIASHRLAHKLHSLEIRLIPRIISEHAHTMTGIDIHPAATIGSYFCIDHGTGIVIGETTHIGQNVKIYQGVTLGALSVEKDYASVKRHPTIEDGVVIYSGSTILGGDTIIGKDSIIGGNVWLTSSVPPKSKIYYKATLSEDGDTSELLIHKTYE